MSKAIFAAFISDLHLNAAQPDITARFDAFIAWAKKEVESVYILGDFLHAWPGDDACSDFELSIAKQLASLNDVGVSCYFMSGNRDFLLGSDFAQKAKWQVLPDPYLLNLDGNPVLLSHGDQFCTQDTAHQWFYWLTRRPSFIDLFTRLPLSWRQYWVGQVRSHSQARQKNTRPIDVDEQAVSRAMRQHQADILIHGHTHRPKAHLLSGDKTRFVLSDWDDSPQVLCYYKTKCFQYLSVI